MKRSTNPPTLPEPPCPRLPLDDADLNFSPDHLPNPAILPCLLRDILRDSVVARRLEQERLGNQAQITHGDDEVQGSFADRIHNLHFNINHQLDSHEFIMEAVAPLDDVGASLDIPWSKLSNRAIRALCNVVNNGKLPVFITDWERHTEQLAKHMRLAVSKDVASFRANKNAPGTARAITEVEDGYLDESKSGLMMFGVVVDYGRYDNNSIKAAMINELLPQILKARPKGMKPKMRKESGLGRIAEWRGVLNSLALARLAGRHSAESLKKTHPAVYDRVAASLKDKGTTAVAKKLRAARERYVARFHEILPFEKYPPLCLWPSSQWK